MQPAILLAVIAAVIAGAMTALQPPTNAMLTRDAGSPLNAALISFAVGTVALAIVSLLLGARPNPSGLRALPVYAWLGGLYGAVFVTAAAFAAPRLGLAFYVALMVAGQMTIGLLVDQFGGFGFDRQPLTPVRIAGAAMLIGGILLLRR